MAETDPRIATVRDALWLWNPTYPTSREVALAALDSIAADLERAERERDEWKQAAGAEAELADAFNADLGIQRADLKAAEARVEQLEGLAKDAAWGLRNQPEISREQIAELLEREAALAPNSGGEE